MKELLIVIVLVVVTLQFSLSQRPISKQPTTNSPKIEVEKESKQEKIEDNIQTNIPPKTVVLSSNKILSRGGSGLEEYTEHNQEDIILLAKLIQSEALSESYEGKLAVGSVVLNRMEEYNATMKEVIYSKYQFSGVNGKLFNQNPSEDCIQAAKDVLNGSKPVGNCTYFVNLEIAKPSWTRQMQFVKKIGKHWFYKSK